MQLLNHLIVHGDRVWCEQNTVEPRLNEPLYNEVLGHY